MTTPIATPVEVRKVRGGYEIRSCDGSLVAFIASREQAVKVCCAINEAHAAAEDTRRLDYLIRSKAYVATAGAQFRVVSMRLTVGPLASKPREAIDAAIAASADGEG